MEPWIGLVVLSLFLPTVFITVSKSDASRPPLHDGQNELEVNIVDQSMARPEVGPNGRYLGAMRFKFVLLRSERQNMRRKVPIL